MLENYTTNNEVLINNAKKDIIFNTNKNVKIISKNNSFRFETINDTDYRLPDGFYTKPYQEATIYNIGTAPTTPNLILYKTNIYNYFNSYSLTLLNYDKSIKQQYYGDIIVYNNQDYLVYGFEIDYKNDTTDLDTTTISATGFSLNPNGNRYNTISYEISNYNPLFFINTNTNNDYYYWNSDYNVQVNASPYVNTDYQLGSYELNNNYAYFKNFQTEDNTISFMSEQPHIYTTETGVNALYRTNLVNYYIGESETPTFNYKYGFVACNNAWNTETSEGLNYNYYYNYTNFLKQEEPTTYTDLQIYQKELNYQNSYVYLNTNNYIRINNNDDIWSTEQPNYKPIELYNKLISTDNITLTLKTINITQFTKTSIINANDIFYNTQNISFGGYTIGILLSAVITFTVIISMLKVGKK